MKTNIIVVDDFYNNPEDVREHALGLSYDTLGNYPGRRSVPEPTEQSAYLKTFFETEIIHKKAINWNNEYNTCYQYTTVEDSTWIHSDSTGWAGVLFLTPDAPIESGTATYESKVSKPDCNNLEHWTQTNFIGNIFNRLVLYNGKLFHRSVLAGFGTSKETGRLFQTFFFDTGE